jgi:hypothetical protein
MNKDFIRIDGYDFIRELLMDGVVDKPQDVISYLRDATNDIIVLDFRPHYYLYYFSNVAIPKHLKKLFKQYGVEKIKLKVIRRVMNEIKQSLEEAP